MKLGRIVALELGRWECPKSHTAKRRPGAGVWTPVRKAEGTRKSPAKFKPVAGRCHGALSVRTCLQRDGDGSLQYSREVSHSTLKAGFLPVFAGGPYCLWCPKSRWSPPLCASIALQISKNGLEVRKLWPPKVGVIVFTKKS